MSRKTNRNRKRRRGLDIQAANSEPTTLTLAAPVEIIAAEAPAEGEAPKRPTFKINAYTGAVMNIGGFHSPVIVDLGGLKASRAKLPIFRDHEPGRIVGQGVPTIDSTGVRIEGQITGKNADSQEVIDQAADGFEWQASIGANITRREFLEAGKTTTVNGREVTGPLVIARESVLKETSFVALGADDQTSASVAATQPRKGTTVDPKFQAWLEAKSITPENLDDATLGALEAAWKAETPAKPSGHEDLDGVVAKRRKEQERVEKITAMADKALESNPRQIEAIEALARLAIEGKWTDEKFELELLRGTRSSVGPYIHSRENAKVTQAAIEASLCRTGGMNSEVIERNFGEQTLEAADKRFPNGIGLQELLLIGARENGNGSLSVRGDLPEVLRAAMPPSEVRASAGFSTLSIPGILSNTANKFLRIGFDSVDSSWMSISSRRSAMDFKTMTSYTMTGDLTYSKVGPTGEIKHGTLGEETYTNKVDTYAKMLGISRADIINDDLGALTRVPQRLGRGAALKLNDVFWTEFLGGVSESFFASGNSNINTGVATMTTAGLTATEVIFMDQTDPDGLPLGIMPAILVVPTALKAAAMTLMDSQNLIDGTSTDAQGAGNIWRGRFQVVSSPYISNSSYTGNTSVGWWMLADPMDLAVIEVAFLNGREAPVVETAQADFDTLGIQMRGYHDFGVNLQEPRGGVYADGGAS